VEAAVRLTPLCVHCSVASCSICAAFKFEFEFEFGARVRR
jgi:hypothetical protein